MRYLYLALAGLVCLAALIVFLARTDLRPAIVAAGLVGGFIEAISEVWYLRDYWKPLTLLPVPTLEDILYGFGVTALAVCAVPFWFGRRYASKSNAPARRQWLAPLLVAFVVLMTLAQAVTGLNSIWAATICYFLGGAVGCIGRPELAITGLAGGLIMGALALFGYWLGLNFIIDGDAFLNRVYLLAGTRWDIRILGQVPLDEVAWNMARGWCMAVMYPFVSGKILLKTHSPK